MLQCQLPRAPRPSNTDAQNAKNPSVNILNVLCGPARGAGRREILRVGEIYVKTTKCILLSAKLECLRSTPGCFAQLTSVSAHDPELLASLKAIDSSSASD